jgi:uncharacterized RDD family membrane protein YckC
MKKRWFGFIDRFRGNTGMKVHLKPRRFSAPHTERLRELNGLPLASFRSRAGAWVCDIILVILIAMIVSVLRAIFSAGPFAQRYEGNIRLELFHDPWGIASIVLYFGLLPFLWRGRTVGKRIFRLRMVSISHDRLTLWQCVERALGYAFSSLEGGFGFFQYFLHPNRQTLHDRIAETIIIKEENQKSKFKKKI